MTFQNKYYKVKKCSPIKSLISKTKMLKKLTLRIPIFLLKLKIPNQPFKSISDTTYDKLPSQIDASGIIN